MIKRVMYFYDKKQANVINKLNDKLLKYYETPLNTLE